MFDNIMNFFKKLVKKEKEKNKESSDTAKERLHLVLMQDRANVSADFLELMRQEIIEVIKKYIDVDESAIDVHLTNKTNEDGTVGAPALYANIPIVTIKNEARKLNIPNKEKQEEQDDNKEPEENKNKEEHQEPKEGEAKEQEEIEDKIEKQEEKENNQDEQVNNTIQEENIIQQEDKKEETTSDN